jgi:FMN phosphatase YigB (HAD superfamily)
MTTDPIVFLVDLDETLMDTERFYQDLAEHLEQVVGPACRDRYRALDAELFATGGYRDPLGALQRYREEFPYEHRLIHLSSYFLEYPFANRLFPSSLKVLERLRDWGLTVIVTDGDMILQPRKIERSGIFDAAEGRILIYIHKERAIEDIGRLYPAKHYVLIDDKLRILSAFKQAWGSRLTTVFPRQGCFAHDPELLAEYPPADVTVERIGDLLNYDLPALLASARLAPSAIPTQLSQETTV